MKATEKTHIKDGSLKVTGKVLQQMQRLGLCSHVITSSLPFITSTEISKFIHTKWFVLTPTKVLQWTYMYTTFLTILSQHNNDLGVCEFPAVDSQVELLCENGKQQQLLQPMEQFILKVIDS